MEEEAYEASEAQEEKDEGALEVSPSVLSAPGLLLRTSVSVV